MTTEQIIKKLEDCELNPCVEEDREVADYAIKCIKACEGAEQTLNKAYLDYTKGKIDALLEVKVEIQHEIDKCLRDSGYKSGLVFALSVIEKHLVKENEE